MLRLEVVLGQPLSYFDRGIADNSILSGIVGNLTAEDPDADRSFLQEVVVAFDRGFDHEPKEGLASFAVSEMGACQEISQLVSYLSCIRRCPDAGASRGINAFGSQRL